MKDFEYVREPYTSGMNNKEYLQLKRETVLETIKPICEAFEITEYDYVVDGGREYLELEGTKIGCSMNSISATVRQLVNYIWMKITYPNVYLEGSEENIYNTLTRCWMEE